MQDLLRFVYCFFNFLIEEVFLSPSSVSLVNSASFFLQQNLQLTLHRGTLGAMIIVFSILHCFTIFFGVCTFSVSYPINWKNKKCCSFREWVTAARCWSSPWTLHTLYPCWTLYFTSPTTGLVSHYQHCWGNGMGLFRGRREETTRVYVTHSAVSKSQLAKVLSCWRGTASSLAASYCLCTHVALLVLGHVFQFSCLWR